MGPGIMKDLEAPLDKDKIRFVWIQGTFDNSLSWKVCFKALLAPTICLLGEFQIESIKNEDKYCRRAKDVLVVKSISAAINEPIFFWIEVKCFDG